MLIKSVSHCTFLLFSVWFSKEMRLIQSQWLSVHLLVPLAPPRNFQTVSKFQPSWKDRKASQRHYHFYEFREDGWKFSKGLINVPSR